jgi:hypothetical protein
MTTWYLQKTLTSAGNTFGFSGTNIQFDFDTALTKVTERIAKKYGGDILRGRSRANWNLYPAINILVDLKQLTWEWTINGILCNSSGNLSGVSPTTSALAVNKKNLLIAVAEQGGTMTWVERNSSVTYTVNILSLEFPDTETEVGTSEIYMKVGEQRIAFTMILRKGQDRG